MTKTVRINADLITDWNTFHDLFKKVFGFPDFYSKNMDAWIDCMTYIDDKDSRMAQFSVNKGDTVVIELTNSEEFKMRCPEIYLQLMECTGFVNQRAVDTNSHTMISIALG